MKKVLTTVLIFWCAVLCLSFSMGTVSAAREDNTYKKGIFAGDISLEGMTKEEAKQAVTQYVESLKESHITLVCAEDNRVAVYAKDLGLAWSNPEVLEEAFNLGKQGNIVKRYKACMDLQYENKVYPIELTFDKNAITTVLEEKCSVYDREAVDYTLNRKDGNFVIEDGQDGYCLDVAVSADNIYQFLLNDWNRENAEINLEIAVTKPRGSKEELSKVQDLLGTYTTSYSTSGSNRSANVANGCRLIDGTLLYPGDEFSTYQTVSPFTQNNGYYMAGSYINGKVVDSLGGGICQVSTTLYNAVLLSELDVTERHNHSMIVTYVSPSADAAIAESAGKDFKFVNNTDYPIYIEGYTQNKKITFNIYGVEYRDSNRTVTYESEVLQTIQPDHENIYPDAGYPVGYVSVTGAHIGYKARLWKVVKENGVEVSREEVNSSNYKVSPRSAVVGISTSDPNAYNEIMAAIGTGSIDHVRNVAAMLTAPPAE